MLRQGLDIVLTRNAFYKKNYRSALTNFLLLILAIGCLALFIYFMKVSVVVARYFPTTPSGLYIEMPPLNENHLILTNFNFAPDGTMLENPDINLNDLDVNDTRNAIVKYWAKKAVVALHDYDYVNYRQALQDMRDYFTLNGHGEFLKALSFSRNMEAVKSNFQVVSARVTGDLQMDFGLLGNKQAWRVLIPLEVKYENASGDEPLIQNVVADLIIVRETTLRVPFYGLAIDKINLKVVG